MIKKIKGAWPIIDVLTKWFLILFMYVLEGKI